MVCSRDTEQEFVNQHQRILLLAVVVVIVFWCFVWLAPEREREEDGEHGDGVQHGEVQQKAKEEEKSAD